MPHLFQRRAAFGSHSQHYYYSIRTRREYVAGLPHLDYLTHFPAGFSMQTNSASDCIGSTNAKMDLEVVTTLNITNRSSTRYSH